MTVLVTDASDFIDLNGAFTFLVSDGVIGAMQPIQETYRQNFAYIVRTMCENNQSVAAERLKFATASLVSRYVTGSKSIGRKSARKFEKIFELPSYWMDQPHNFDEMEGIAPALAAEPESPLSPAARELIAAVTELDDQGLIGQQIIKHVLQGLHVMEKVSEAAQDPAKNAFAQMRLRLKRGRADEGKANGERDSPETSGGAS